MMVRLVPYAEIFVSVVMDLDEAVTVADALALVRAQKAAALTKTAEELRQGIEDAVERAADLQAKRGY